MRREETMTTELQNGKAELSLYATHLINFDHGTFLQGFFNGLDQGNRISVSISIQGAKSIKGPGIPIPNSLLEALYFREKSDMYLPSCQVPTTVGLVAGHLRTR